MEIGDSLWNVINGSISNLWTSTEKLTFNLVSDPMWDSVDDKLRILVDDSVDVTPVDQMWGSIIVSTFY